MKFTLKNIPLYPFFFSAFPVCSLLGANLDKAGVNQLILPLAIVLCCTALLYLVFGLILKNTQLSALLTIILSLSFLCYGHCILSFMAFVYSGIRPEFFLSVFYFLVAALSLITICMLRKKNLEDLSFILNTVSLCVLVAVVVPIFRFSAREHFDLSQRFQPGQPSKQSTAGDFATEKPDVYYIILDGMERSDVLKAVFDLDDSKFIQFLESKGFFVAKESHSNYAYTALSLASSLNMEYINWLSKQVGESNKNWNPLFEMIVSSEAIKAFKKHGYKYIHFNSSFFATGENPLADEIKTINWISPLMLACLQLTPIGIHTRIWHPAHDELRKQKLAQFKALEDVVSEPGPKIVFAHIVMPHMPFLFDENGNAVNGSLYSYMDEWADRKGYRGQVIFVQKKMKVVIENMLKNSAKPPVIIIQGDHGAGSACQFDMEHPSREFLVERMSILNAYLLPANAKSKPYDAITPVNSFRIILNSCLGYQLPLLPDKVYFSPFNKPYKFFEVSKELLDSELDKTKQK